MSRLSLGTLAIVASVALTGPLYAQTTTPADPPVATAPSTDPNAPLAGANSFTESQAKDRIEKAGFTEVSGLKKDDNGIWRGTAKSGGSQTNVSLDYRGNVVAK
jgi:hypothetical protein